MRTVDAVIGVDYSGFNLRFAEAIAQETRGSRGPFENWRPRLVQYISPQVWASRPGRSKQVLYDAQTGIGKESPSRRRTWIARSNDDAFPPLALHPTRLPHELPELLQLGHAPGVQVGVVDAVARTGEFGECRHLRLGASRLRWRPQHTATHWLHRGITVVGTTCAAWDAWPVGV